jgi:hypothetical protein
LISLAAKCQLNKGFVVANKNQLLDRAR